MAPMANLISILNKIFPLCWKRCHFAWKWQLYYEIRINLVMLTVLNRFFLIFLWNFIFVTISLGNENENWLYNKHCYNRFYFAFVPLYLKVSYLHSFMTGECSACLCLSFINVGCQCYCHFKLFFFKFKTTDMDVH